MQFKLALFLEAPTPENLHIRTLCNNIICQNFCDMENHDIMMINEGFTPNMYSGGKKLSEDLLTYDFVVSFVTTKHAILDELHKTYNNVIIISEDYVTPIYPNFFYYYRQSHSVAYEIGHIQYMMRRYRKDILNSPIFHYKLMPIIAIILAYLELNRKNQNYHEVRNGRIVFSTEDTARMECPYPPESDL